jgi:hypothetical protein
MRKATSASATPASACNCAPAMVIKNTDTNGQPPCVSRLRSNLPKNECEGVILRFVTYRKEVHPLEHGLKAWMTSRRSYKG